MTALSFEQELLQSLHSLSTEAILLELRNVSLLESLDEGLLLQGVRPDCFCSTLLKGSC